VVEGLGLIPWPIIGAKDSRPYGACCDVVPCPVRQDRPNNSTTAFKDNSRAVRGFKVTSLKPEHPEQPSTVTPYTHTLHPTLTAETRNFPKGVAPFPAPARRAGYTTTWAHHPPAPQSCLPRCSGKSREARGEGL
jgi:hypothetical protein